MPQITINGKTVEITPGEMIIKAANRAGVDIPQYCYHDGLSVVASCRICLGEVWQPDAKTGQLAPLMGGKLLPTCQTAAQDGMVVYTDSPKAVANQKAVMEYLLINHPLDCPVCDQAGECYLQDYSYQYGRGVSRFEETKVKQPKKDLGPHVYLYADRCIMCTRCVRFTREVSGTAELLVAGRGNREEIDIFPGQALDNPLSGNVVDLCPVGALLDKDFLFAQRVWFLKSVPSIDGLTASGDNILIEHNDDTIYRVKPRVNMAVNKWWITDEVRHGWKFVHSPERLRQPGVRRYGVRADADWPGAVREAAEAIGAARGRHKGVAVVLSPMLSCEDAYELGSAVRAIEPTAILTLGPVPRQGQDQTFPPGRADGFKVWAEKAPNARGVGRVIEALGGDVRSFEDVVRVIDQGHMGAAVITGNYPSAWATPGLLGALGASGPGRVTAVVIDTLASALSERADVLLPSVTWAEKAGTFVSGRGMAQAFERAVSAVPGARAEGQVGLDLAHVARGLALPGPVFNAAQTRATMARVGGLEELVRGVVAASLPVEQTPDMEVVEL